jgi:hypothetical protein
MGGIDVLQTFLVILWIRLTTNQTSQQAFFHDWHRLQILGSVVYFQVQNIEVNNV